MEDQPADAGDLTEESAATATEDASETPDAKTVVTPRRAGRHRFFRPRPPAAQATEETAADEAGDASTAAETMAEEPAAQAESEPSSDEAATEVAATAVDAETAEEAAAEAPAPPPEANRGGGFRRLRRRGPQAAPAATPDAKEEVAAEEAAATEEPAEEPAEPVEDESPTEVSEITTRARKPATRSIKVAVAAAAALFVAAAAFAGAMVQPYLVDQALVNTKLDIARTATSAITTLWTYTPENMDSLPDRAAKYLSGDFEDQYRKYIDAIAPVNKQAKVSNSTDVVGAAVESLNGTDATAVVYTNTTNTSPQSNNIPSMQYLSYRLTMQRHDSRWLITKMTTVTSLDLTPRLN